MTRMCFHFSDSEIEKILKACETFDGNGPRIKALTELMLATGLRISDACTISRERFVKDSDGWKLHLRTAKTKTPVLIPVQPEIVEAIEALPGRYPFWSGDSLPENCSSVWQEAYRKLLQARRYPRPSASVSPYVCEKPARQRSSVGDRQSASWTQEIGNYGAALRQIRPRETGLDRGTSSKNVGTFWAHEEIDIEKTAWIKVTERCPGWESNPHEVKSPEDFKSPASAIPPPGQGRVKD